MALSRDMRSIIINGLWIVAEPSTSIPIPTIVPYVCLSLMDGRPGQPSECGLSSQAIQKRLQAARRLTSDDLNGVRGEVMDEIGKLAYVELLTRVKAAGSVSQATGEALYVSNVVVPNKAMLVDAALRELRVVLP